MMSDLGTRMTYVDSLNPIQRQMLTELGVDFLWGEALAPTLQKTAKASVEVVEPSTDAGSELAGSRSEPQKQYVAQRPEPIVAATQEVASANADMARKMLQRAKHRLPTSVADEAVVATEQRVATSTKAALDSQSSQSSTSSSNELSALSWQELSTLAATQEFDIAIEQRVVSVFEDKSEGRQCDWLFLDQLFYLDAERNGLSKAKQVQTLFAQILLALGLEQSEVAVLPLLKSQIATHGQGPATVGPILLEQINRLQPKCIVAFGDAAASLLQEDKGLLALMNQTQLFQHPVLGQIPVVTIFSPYYLLSNGAAKAQTWQGLKRARQIIRGHAY